MIVEIYSWLQGIRLLDFVVTFSVQYKAYSYSLFELLVG